jgi:hypothetical protein
MKYMMDDNGTKREMTKQEEENFIAWQKLQLTEVKAKQEEEAAKEAAKTALLERLGITADEAKLLLS